MFRNLITIAMFIAVSIPTDALTDELTQIIQQDLITLGYDPGAADGEVSTKTIVAVSKFQAENNLEVTGEATPQLAGIIKATIKNQGNPVAASASAVTATESASDSVALNPEELRAAQNACLQERIQAAQSSQKKKRGFGSLMRAVGRTANRLGGTTAADIAQTSRDVYDVNATTSDLDSAAKDLGLTESDIEACRNPL